MHYTKEWTIEVREDIFNQLREENSLLTQENIELRNKLELIIRMMSKLTELNRKLRAENEYLHKLLPEADGYVIEKQMEQRLWNDWEEDVYEY